MQRPNDITPRQITATQSQILRLEPIVARIMGGGTSGVLFRGDEQVATGGVRVSVDNPETSGNQYATGASVTSVAQASPASV